METESYIARLSALLKDVERAGAELARDFPAKPDDPSERDRWSKRIADLGDALVEKLPGHLTEALPLHEALVGVYNSEQTSEAEGEITTYLLNYLRECVLPRVPARDSIEAIARVNWLQEDIADGISPEVQSRAFDLIRADFHRLAGQRCVGRRT
ncbi:MAG: hypothetical protein KIT81_06935 [Alphaproteobacteria bacterium]|nr:hypothetical protein [Alphaproteobacteria bacterium]